MTENHRNSQKLDVHNNERGSAGTNFLIVVIVLFLAGHAAYNYVPIAYNGEDLKQKMHERVLYCYASPNTPDCQPEKMKARLRHFCDINDVPPDAFIKVDKTTDGAPRAQISYTKQVNMLPFGLYKYNYQFNHIEQPVGFLTKQ
jgi:hypothetical protein